MNDQPPDREQSDLQPPIPLRRPAYASSGERHDYAPQGWSRARNIGVGNEHGGGNEHGEGNEHRGESSSSIPSWARLGAVDFRMARRHLIAEYQRHRLGREDICDAQPELIRAATHVGHTTEHECPICEEANLIYVSYVFGDSLPAHGRVVANAKEMAALSREHDELACYVVEVCVNCRWNHLARMFQSGRAHAR